MFKYKLHPITAVINGLKSLKGMIFPFLVIVVANGFNISMDIRDERFWGEMVPFLVLVIIVIFTFIHGIVKWVTFRYWFEDSELRVQYGLFIKKNRFIPFERIQSLNYKEGIFHRILGLVQVSVETAGSSNAAEAELTAITKEAANRIEREMNAAKRGTVVDEIDLLLELEQRVVYKMSPLELVLLATTSGGIGVILFGVVTGITQFIEFIPFEKVAGELEYFVKYSFLFITVLIIIGLITAWMLSVALTLLNYYDFKVSIENDKLIITRGLLEKKRVTIPLNRVQAIVITENPIRQIFGLATVTLETAGGGFAEKGELNNSVKLFPLIVKKDIIKPLQTLFPHFELEFNNNEMKKSPFKARPFFYRLDFFWWIPVVGLVSYFTFPYGLLSLLTIIPIVLLGGWRHRTSAFIHSNGQIVIVSRLFSKKTFIAEKKRIQSMEMRQSIFQKGRGIASLKISVMSGVSGVASVASHMEEKDINACMNWYERNMEND